VKRRLQKVRIGIPLAPNGLRGCIHWNRGKAGNPNFNQMGRQVEPSRNNGNDTLQELRPSALRIDKYANGLGSVFKFGTIIDDWMGHFTDLLVYLLLFEQIKLNFFFCRNAILAFQLPSN
jgi:hypothetical protein